MKVDDREPCSLCGRPTKVALGEVDLPVRHAACHEAFMAMKDMPRETTVAAIRGMIAFVESANASRLIDETRRPNKMF